MDKEAFIQGCKCRNQAADDDDATQKCAGNQPVSSAVVRRNESSGARDSTLPCHFKTDIKKIHGCQTSSGNVCIPNVQFRIHHVALVSGFSDG